MLWVTKITVVPVSEQIRGVGARLRKLFSFTDYVPLDEVVLQGLEGEPVSWSLGGSYRIDFLMESGGGGDVVRLRNLVLSRVRRDEKGRETYLPHPAHAEFVKLVGPRVKDVLVFDYWSAK